MAARRFEGKTAVVTGGANGIGLAICCRLAQEGARVFVADIDAAAGPAALDAVRCAAGGAADVNFVQVDMSKEAEVLRLIRTAAPAPDGRLHVFVNNAARFVFGEVTDVTEEQWDAALGTNVKGYAWGLKYALRVMQRNGGSASGGGGGAIVNIASGCSSFIAQPAFVPYSTTKGAIIQMTRCAALDSAKWGVRVNAVCPGPILTDGTKRHAAMLGVSLEEACAEMTSHQIIPRMGTVDEVAAAVAFLASDEAGFITGHPLIIDGGYTTL